MSNASDSIICPVKGIQTMESEGALNESRL